MYGHSKVDISYRTEEYRKPPDILYHGTSKEALNIILKEGLKPQGRRFVHLCRDLDEAYKIGRRHSDTPKVLVIKANEAYNKGIRFVKKENIYLTEHISPEFILPLKDRKAEVRERIWRMFEERKLIYSLTAFGKIPNFKGKERAAEILANQSFFKTSQCVFCAPDGSLLPIREIILKEKKTLIVVLPRMKGFLEIREPRNIKEAAAIKGFLTYGKQLTSDIKIDLFIQGAVAVDRFGNRLGKGTGFGDKEWEYLKRKDLLSNKCKVVCVVHNLQIVDDLSDIMNYYDKKADYIITPEEIINCSQKQLSLS
jgi:5-formyltetrahydrofolate cyclo-ligase